MMRQFLMLAMLLGPVAARAQPPESQGLPAAGNLPSGFYVASACIKPDKKTLGTPAYNDPQQVSVYNFRIQRYNKASAAFNDCLKAYLDKSQHDIERILTTVNTAVAEARGTAPPAPPAADGNMPADFYPHSPCARPDQGALGAQPSPTDRKAMTAYNLRVKTFNEQAVTFNTCLKTFTDNAQRDIAQIQESAHAAAASSAGQGGAAEKP